MIRKTSHLALKSFVFLFLVIHANLCFAKDFGKMANTFEVKEEGFVAMMQRKLEKVDLEAENEKMQKTAKERVENPKPVAFIKKAEETKTFYFDPTYTLLEDILLPNGQVLHKAGYRVNPLDHIKLNRRMFFIDARDEEQVEWLKQELTKYDSKKPDSEKSHALNTDDEIIENRIILTAGKIFELQKELGEEDRVYFDQGGELTKKFGIKAVPAIAIEEDKKIKITEFDITNDEEN